jgi:hypothetical protein
VGTRPQLDARIQAEERIAFRPTRLHGIFDQEGAFSGIKDSKTTRDTRRDGYTQDEEGLGSRNRAREAAPYERIWYVTVTEDSTRR